MNSVQILNGPMGTELQRRGYKTTLPLWSGSANLDAPDLVKQIHTDYAQMGVDILVTNTFRTNPRAWRKVNREKEAVESTKRAIELALEVKNKYPNILVAASITTLEDCYEPTLVPPQSELEDEHGSQIELFKNSGVDFMLIETINTIREAKTILKFATDAKLKSWVSFVSDEKGNLMSGESIEEMLKEILPLNPEVLGVNCRPPEIIIHAAKKLAENFEGKKMIYANGDGQPANDLGWEFFDRCDPKEYLEHAKEWIDLGFRVIGSCCGSSPEHIKKVIEDLKD